MGCRGTRLQGEFVSATIDFQSHNDVETLADGRKSRRRHSNLGAVWGKRKNKRKSSRRRVSAHTSRDLLKNTRDRSLVSIFVSEALRNDKPARAGETYFPEVRPSQRNTVHQQLEKTQIYGGGESLMIVSRASQPLIDTNSLNWEENKVNNVQNISCLSGSTQKQNNGYSTPRGKALDLNIIENQTKERIQVDGEFSKTSEKEASTGKRLRATSEPYLCSDFGIVDVTQNFIEDLAERASEEIVPDKFESTIVLPQENLYNSQVTSLFNIGGNDSSQEEQVETSISTSSEIRLRAMSSDGVMQSRVRARLLKRSRSKTIGNLRQRKCETSPRFSLEVSISTSSEMRLKNTAVSSKA